MDVHEVPKKPSEWILLSIQHLFAMFGATILVPFLTDLSPAVALISSGTGTIAYLLITKGKIPAYLGSISSRHSSYRNRGSNYPNYRTCTNCWNGLVSNYRCFIKFTVTG